MYMCPMRLIFAQLQLENHNILAAKRQQKGKTKNRWLVGTTFSDNTMARDEWKTKTQPDKVGFIRRLEIKTRNSVLVRPISKLCLILEADTWTSFEKVVEREKLLKINVWKLSNKLIRFVDKRDTNLTPYHLITLWSRKWMWMDQYWVLRRDESSEWVHRQSYLTEVHCRSLFE